MIRVAAHVAIWTVVLLPVLSKVARGWRPLDDYAVIALRSWTVFSAHPPLLGLYSTATPAGGHAVYDPGPLLFWLLALPVHLDPAHGVLWGAGLLTAVILSVAAEAAWSVVGWLGVAIVALTVADVGRLIPTIFENVAWNAYFGLVFFFASAVLAFAVAAGRLGWWPVLVLSTSVAAQSHLFFVVGGVLLALVTPVMGVVRRGRPVRRWWLVAGIAVGVACWAAPLVQQLTGHPGNISMILGVGGRQSTIGGGSALRILAMAASPSPIWLAHLPSGLFNIIGLAYAHGPGYGIGVLTLLAAIAAVSWWTGRRDLAALALVTDVTLAAMAASAARLPTRNLISLGYLLDSQWFLGVLVWATVVWAGLELLREAPRYWRSAAHVARPHSASLGTPQRRARMTQVVTAVALAAIVLVVVLDIRSVPLNGVLPGDDWPTVVPRVNRMAAAIERTYPHTPIVLSVSESSQYIAFEEEDGVAWTLTSRGLRVALPWFFAQSAGLAIPPHNRWPVIVVTERPHQPVTLKHVR
ncbi:MAG: hypothetical protein ABSH04_08320 [Acidimicrobiales bacterium]